MTEDDLIGRTKRELRERIASLEAAVEELPRLKGALAALEGDARAPAPARRRAAVDGRSSGRRRPRGANRDAILAVIGQRPGVSVGEVANVVAKQGVKKNVVYTTVNKLTKDGLVVKRDGALELTASGDSATGGGA